MDERFVEIAAAVDAEFARNRNLHGERMHCRPGCTDCCHHLFEISRIEAAALAEGVRRMEPEARVALEARAHEYLDARQTLVTEHGGRLPSRGARIPCPALVDGMCSLYEFRPLICHQFGMPIYNPERPDRVMACELNFQDGQEIDDPHLIQIQTQIHTAWTALRSPPGDRVTIAEAILQAPQTLPLHA